MCILFYRDWESGVNRYECAISPAGEVISDNVHEDNHINGLQRKAIWAPTISCLKPFNSVSKSFHLISDYDP